MTEEKQLSEETQKEIVKLQNYQRQLQIIITQMQRLEIELTQINSGLSELEKAKGKTFKAIGSILIEEEPKQLIEDLNKRRNDINERIETLKKQEDRVKTKAEETQKQLQEEFEPKSS